MRVLDGGGFEVVLAGSGEEVSRNDEAEGDPQWLAGGEVVGV